MQTKTSAFSAGDRESYWRYRHLSTPKLTVPPRVISLATGIVDFLHRENIGIFMSLDGYGCSSIGTAI
jgi:hypothetical protein